MDIKAMLGAIDHVECFPIDKKSYIRIHFNDWIREIFKGKQVKACRNASVAGLIPADKKVVLEPSLLNTSPLYTADVQSEYSSILKDIRVICGEEEDNSLRGFFYDIMKMESYNNSTIGDMLHYISSTWFNNFKSDYDDNKLGSLKAIPIIQKLEYLIFNIIKYKIEGKSAYNDMFATVKEADDYLNHIHNYYENILLTKIMTSYSLMGDTTRRPEEETNMAILLYLLYIPMKLKPSHDATMFFSLLDYHYSNGSAICNICQELESNQQDTLDLISKLTGESLLPEKMDIIASNNVRVGIESLCVKNKISESCGKNILVFGDGLPEDFIKEDMLIDLDLMTKDEVCKYAPSDLIEFEIPADDRMFIEKELQYKKIVVKNSLLPYEQYVIMVPMEDETKLCLCFKCTGDPIIYALSLSKDSERSRTLVTMEKNEAARYMMLYGKEIEHGNY